MNVIEVKTAELTGPSLNWATFCAVYTGMQPTIRIAESETRQVAGLTKPITFARVISLTYTGAYGIENHWYPSSDWECGGPLIDRFEVEILRAGSEVHAKLYGLTDSSGCGPSALIAACRAVVAAKLGSTVSIPAELI